MISRDKLEEVIDALVAHDSALARDRLEKKEFKDQTAASWSVPESAMVNPRDLPKARAMIDRLEAKYGDLLDQRGGTWEVLGVGSRFTMSTRIPLEPQREPYTYLLIQAHPGAPWSLYYINGQRELSPAKDLNSIPALKAALDKLPAISAEEIFRLYEKPAEEGFTHRYDVTPPYHQNPKPFIDLEKVFARHRHGKLDPKLTLAGIIQEKIKESKDEKEPRGKHWDHQVMLRALAEPTWGVKGEGRFAGQTWHYPNTNPIVTVHGYSLARILALQFLAARDENQVLRPQVQLAVDLAPSHEKQAARTNAIEGGFDRDFLFNLFDIRREHSEDDPIRRLDLIHDVPSCPGGTFGRSVFRLSASNAVSVFREGKVEQVEAAAKADAEALRPRALYLPIPDAIVNFIFNKLEEHFKRGEDTFPKAIYFFYNRYLLGIQPENNEEEQVEWKLFDQSKRSFNSFLNNLNSQELFRYLQEKIPSLKLSGPESIARQFAIIQMFSIILEDLRPETMMKKNLEEVLRNPPALELTQRFLNLGARMYVVEGMQALVYRDETVVSLRNRIREIAPVVKASFNFVDNEVRRALLALIVLAPQNGNADNIKKWRAIRNKIQQKLAFIREDLIQERMLRVKDLQDLSEQLNHILRKREDNLLGLEQADFMGEELNKLRKKATGVCEDSLKQITNIQELIHIFELISLKVEQSIGMGTSAGPGPAAAAAVESKTVSQEGLADSIRKLVTRFDWGNPERREVTNLDCATQLVRPLLSLELSEQEKDREFKRVQDILANARWPDNITAAIPDAFHKVLNEPQMAKLDWNTKNTALKKLSVVYPKAYGGWLEVKKLTQLDQEGRDLYGDLKISEQVYSYAAIPLHLASLEIKGPRDIKAITTPSETFKANFTNWFEMGKKLINSSERKQTAQFTGADDSCVKKLIHFVELTICQNLGLTELRVKEREAIGKLCRVYLISSEEIKIDNAPSSETPVLDRLFWLGIHLAKMITSLKPLSTIYNTGHLRIMDSEETRIFGSLFPDNPRNRKILFRTSMSKPTSIVHVQYKIVKDDKGVERFYTRSTLVGDEICPIKNAFSVRVEVTGLKKPSTGIQAYIIDYFQLVHQNMLEEELAKVAPQLAMMPLENNVQLAAALAAAQTEHAKQATVINEQYSNQSKKVQEAATRLGQIAYSGGAGPGTPAVSPSPAITVSLAAPGVGGLFESKASTLDEGSLEEIVHFLNEVHAPFGNQNWWVDKTTKQVFYKAPSAYYTDGKGHTGNQVSNELRQFTDKAADAGFTQASFWKIFLNLKPLSYSDESIYHSIEDTQALNDLLNLARKWQERKLSRLV